ncbi:MAG: hypothetical protein AAGB12_03130 [Pseudomonadota bacterium]
MHDKALQIGIYILVFTVIIGCQTPNPAPYSKSHGVIEKDIDEIRLNEQETRQRSAVKWKGQKNEVATIALRQVLPELFIKDFSINKDSVFFAHAFAHLVSQTGYLTSTSPELADYWLDVSYSIYKPFYLSSQQQKTLMEQILEHYYFFDWRFFGIDQNFINLRYHLIHAESGRLVKEFSVSTTLGHCEHPERSYIIPARDGKAFRYYTSSVGQTLIANINQSLSEIIRYLKPKWLIFSIEKMERYHLVINQGREHLNPNDQLHLIYTHPPLPRNAQTPPFHTPYTGQRYEILGRVKIVSTSKHHAIGHAMNFSPKLLKSGDKVLLKKYLGWPLFESTAQAGECL